MASNQVTLQSVHAQGWRMGFANLFRKEFDGWWHTRTWLVHTIIWLVLINGIVLAVLKAPVPEGVDTPPESAVLTFVTLGGLMTGIGIIIVMQGAILDEKRTGTAAWVLSKPLSRKAFIFAKLVANGLNSILIMIVLQGIVVLAQFKAFDSNPPDVLPFLIGLGLIALHLLFYLTLTVMLGTLFNERGAVLGIPIGLLFGVQFLMQLAPFLTPIMPWTLVLPPLGGGMTSSLALAVMLGQPLPTITPIIGTVLWIIIFIGVALWRFEREEF